MNRIDRLSAILIQLQSKPVIRSHEIANRFGISQRTVYRDIRALEEAGIPIGSEAGIGYFLAEGFHLPPVMFTKKEAGSLLLAEKLVEKMTDASIDRNFKSAMYKIKSVLDASDKSYLDNLDSYIEIAGKGDHVQNLPNHFMSDIQDTIARQMTIVIEYQSYSKNEQTKREIEPVGICYYGSNWHLIGFCKLRKDYRDFRVDRIQSLQVAGNKFTSEKKKSLQEYFNLLTDREKLEKVVLRFSKETAKYVSNQRYYFGFVEEKVREKDVEMSFLVNSIEYIARWVITYGKEVTVVSPIELITEIKAIVAELNCCYSV